MNVYQDQSGCWVATINGTPNELARSIRTRDEAVEAAKRLKAQMDRWLSQLSDRWRVHP